MKKIFIFSVLLLLLFPSNFLVAKTTQETAATQEFSAGEVDVLRIEGEDKIQVPADKGDEVYDFLYSNYVENTAALRKLDPLLSSYASEEKFVDTYFDTSGLRLYATGNGVRYRRRTILSGPDASKDGSELMQIKLSDISQNQLQRAEYKFDIKHYNQAEDADDEHAMIGLVKRSERDAFKQRLTDLGLDPYDMKPILTLTDFRRRIYIYRDGEPFVSFTLDHATSKIWWAKADFLEIEPEMNEIAYTDGDAAMRKYLEDFNDNLIKTLQEKFPYLERDLTPKYSKAIDQLSVQIPFLRTLMELNLHTREGFVSVIITITVCVCMVVYLVRRNIKRKKFELKKNKM